MKIHIVQKGDTLWKIAKKYGVNFEELKKMNSQLSNPDMIMPGMKIKVPTTGGSVKKEAPMGTKPESSIKLGTKKEMPIAEHPFAKEKPVPLPIKEAPIVKEQPIVKEAPIVKEQPIVKEKPIVKEQPISKEQPIKEQPIKEIPKTPYTPKMPLQIIPEIDVNNYYTSNMSNMIVQPNLPPKPANILPEVKEVPKKEVPIKEVPMKEVPVMPSAPVQELPVQAPPQDCVPITPIMPGPGFCPPFDGMPFPMPTAMPYPAVQGAGFVPHPGMVHGTPGFNPAVAGTSVMPGQFFHDESSSFMPQMPVMNPAYNPGAVMGTYAPGMDPHAFGQMPMGYGGMPVESSQMGFGGAPGVPTQMPMGFGGTPGVPTQMPMGFGGAPGVPTQMPMGFGGAPGVPTQMPMGFGGAPGVPTQMQMGFGGAPAGFTQMPSEFGGMPAGAASMPTGFGEVPPGYGQMPTGFREVPPGYGQMPTGFNEVPPGYGQMPTGFGEVPGGYGQMPTGFGEVPGGYGQMPMGYGGVPGRQMQMPMEYGGMPAGSPVDPMTGAMGYPVQNPAGTAQMAPTMPGQTFGTPGMASPYGMGTTPYGYPPMGGPGTPITGVHDFESSDLYLPQTGAQMPYMTGPTQGLPVGGGGDCGCGGGGGMQPAGMIPSAVPTSFVPPTPPIYSAPYTGPINVAQPPYMNPYGMGPAGTNPYGMPGYRDESN